MSSKNLLILFAKYPEPGKVMTRLNPPFSYEECALLHWAMVEDLYTLLGIDEQISEFDFHVYCSPADKISRFRDKLGASENVFPQQGADLGEKLHNAFIDSFEQGYDKTAIIGSDCLDLTVQDICKAFDRLDTAKESSAGNGNSNGSLTKKNSATDVVVGPTEDGGYYLIGASRPVPRLFDKIKWSTDSVFSDTVDLLSNQNIQFASLPKKYDVDSFEEVNKLWLDSHSNGSVKAERTFAFLKNSSISSKLLSFQKSG